MQQVCSYKRAMMCRMFYQFYAVWLDLFYENRTFVIEKLKGASRANEPTDDQPTNVVDLIYAS